MKTLPLTILFLLTNYFILFSQEYEYRHITVDDGLPASEVFHCFQDNKGYIWFATNMGVSRYDGYEFQNFDLQDGLTDNTILEIFQDEKERIWFVTFSLNLCYYKDGKIHQYQYNNKIQEFLKGTYVQNKTSFYVDEADNIYIGILNYGLIKIDSLGKIKKFNKESDIKSLLILEKKEKIINGIIKPNQLKKIKVFSQDTIFSHKFSYGKIRWQNNTFSLKINQDDWLLGFEGKLLRFNDKRIKKIHDLQKRIIWMSKDNYNIWIATYNGVYRYSKNNLIHLKEHLLKNHQVTSVLADHEGGYWFSTLNSGVFYLPSLTFKKIDKNSGLPGSSIREITHDKENNIWIADQKNNVLKLSPQNKILNVFNFPESVDPQRINSLDYNVLSDEIYISNGYRIKNNKLKKLPESYKAIEIVSSEKKYFTSSHALYIIKDNKTFNISSSNNPEYRLGPIYTIEDGLLIGGLKGLFLFKNKDLTHLGYIDKRFNYRITTIKKYKKHFLLGTRGGGILIYNPDNNEVKQITSEDNLSSNNITEIIIHENFAFAATNNGFSRIEMYNLAEGYYSIDQFSTFSGLPSKEINDLDIVDSTLYLATNNGLAYATLEDITINQTPPKVHLKNISISGKDTIIKKHYNLPHDKNFITINYTGLSYKKRGNISYRYKMNGIQNEWKETRKTEKMFTTLPPGEYTFQVLAKNENGIWSEETAKTSFNIKKPYWKTWWFISVITAVCILVFYLIFHFRFKLVRRKKQLIQDINNYKQIVLRQQMNPHFLFNTLNSIQYYLLDNDTHSSLAYLSKFARLMRKILDNSQQTYISIQDEVNTLKLYLDLEQIRLDNSFRYGINVDDSLNLEENKIPSLLLQPYVENSIHHGLRYKENSDGYIEININKQKEHIKFTIKDNGIGRKKAEEINKRKSREKTPLGSKITEDRIKTLNALYHENILINYEDIKSQNNTIQGTKVEIFIPVTFYSKAQN